jgi:Xaa-Pro aminopeptidase
VSAKSSRRIALLALLLLPVCACGNASAQALSPDSHVVAEGQARFRQSNDEYRARRQELRVNLDAPLVLYGYTGHEDSSEVAVFFQEPNFYYLTGFSEAGAVLVIAPIWPVDLKQPPTRTEVLYLPERDLKQEIWDGPELGPDDTDVKAETGFVEVKPIGRLKADLATFKRYYHKFYTLLPPEHEEGYPHFTESVAALRSLLADPDFQIKDISATLYKLRQVKSEGEIALIQKAVDASIDAQFDAMKTMRPGLYEYQIAARMKEIHEWNGCAREAYAPIVGAGFNSTVLHYGSLNSEIKDGDVVVMDVAGEYGGYAADITRTVPANGKFTPRQREIYDLVLGAQNAALAAVKPGATMFGSKDSLQQIVIDYFNSHPDKNGKVLTKYYPHGVSHHLGLDVHDPGDRTRPLVPGMVITVEPGLYIPEENIGVRIEDDVLVTPDGHKLLTAPLPRSADEIEHIMASSHTGSARPVDTPPSGP